MKAQTRQARHHENSTRNLRRRFRQIMNLHTRSRNGWNHIKNGKRDNLVEAKMAKLNILQLVKTVKELKMSKNSGRAGCSYTIQKDSIITSMSIVSSHNRTRIRSVWHSSALTSLSAAKSTSVPVILYQCSLGQ